MTVVKPGSGRTTFRTLLRQDRVFRWFWVGQSVSSLGDGLYPVAIAVFVLHNGGDAAVLGVVLGARALGTGAFLFVGGWAADRWSRSTVMLIADVVRATILAVLACLPAGTPTVVMAAATLVLGVGEAFFAPAASAVLPALVPGSDLQAATSARALTTTLSQALGPALSGLATAALGARATLLVDASTFLASWVSLAFVVRYLRAAPFPRPDDIRLLAGLHEVMRRRWLAYSIGSGSVVTFVGLAPLLLLLPVMASQRTSNAQLYGWWLTCYAIGAVAGSALANRLPARWGGVIAQLGLVPIAAALTALRVGWSAWLVGLMLVLVGVGYSLYGVLWAVSVQRSVPAAVLGRVMAVDAALAFSAIPAGYALTGSLVSRIGSGPVLLVATVVTVLAAAVVLAVPGVASYGASGSWTRGRGASPSEPPSTY